MSTPARHAFVTDTPDLSTFAWPDGGPEDVGDAAPPTSRIQVAKTGAFKHPRYGAFKVTKATFDSFIANLAGNVVGDRLPMDFDHEPDYGGSTAACGWITGLEADGDALFATVEWLWDGAYAIREGRYRWISPTWQLAYTDDSGAARGPTMLAAALTNRPFFSRMAAVSLSRSFSTAFAGLPERTIDLADDHAVAVDRFDRMFAIGLERIPASVRPTVQAAYARDPKHGMFVLDALLKTHL